MPLQNLNWLRSTHSGENGGDCIELASVPGAEWRRSSYTGSNGSNCVELADMAGSIVAVRDSKDPDDPVLLVPRGALRTALASSH